MIYTKRQTSKGKTKTVELTEDTKFYAQCANCGKEVEATNEIIDDFWGFLFEESRVYCENCTAAHDSNNAN